MRQSQSGLDRTGLLSKKTFTAAVLEANSVQRSFYGGGNFLWQKRSIKFLAEPVHLDKSEEKVLERGLRTSETPHLSSPTQSQTLLSIESRGGLGERVWGEG